MSKRMTIATPRKGKDAKTYWTNIGTAWFNDNGQIQLVFDALPLTDSEGRCVANLFEPREKVQSYNGDPRTNSSGSVSQHNYAEDAPF
jgi:hypothetical protein